MSPSVFAGDISLSTNFEYFSFDNDTENKITLEKTNSSSTAFNQFYRIKISRQIYPFLDFDGGGGFKFENMESSVDGVRSDSEKSTLKPHLAFRLNNPFIKSGVRYESTEVRQKSGGKQETVRKLKTYDSFLFLRPVELPEVDLQYSVTEDSRDNDEAVQNRKQVIMRSRYHVDGINVDYNLTRNTTENRQGDFRTDSTYQSGSVRYSISTPDGKVHSNAGYRFTRSRYERSGTGSLAVPVLRWEGLYSLDLTPEDGPSLAPLAGLVDGNTGTPTSLDIGLAGDETTMTNIGVDLGFETKVDTIHLWVDRQLTQEVADSFVWYVYTSPDNTDSSQWQLHATVSHADFGTFKNRFEIGFQPVTTRFIKVAVVPLLPSVAGASGFPNIYVTEMEVLSSLTGKNSSLSKSGAMNYNIQWRMSARTSLGYDWRLQSQQSDSSTFENTYMTQGFSLKHTFSRVFSSRTAVSIQNLDNENYKSTTYNYSAIFWGRYLKTFSQTLSISGRGGHDDNGHSNSEAISLRNNAQLYRGWSLNMDTGMSRSRPANSPRTETVLFKVGSKISPNDMVIVNLDYKAKRTHTAGTEERLKEQGGIQTFVRPSQTVSFLTRLQYVTEEGERKTTQRYNLDWAPIYDGTLQFSLSYDQEYRSENSEEITVLSPGLSWRINRRAVLRSSYNLLKRDSDTETVETGNFNANLNVNF